MITYASPKLSYLLFLTLIYIVTIYIIMFEFISLIYYIYTTIHAMTNIIIIIIIIVVYNILIQVVYNKYKKRETLSILIMYRLILLLPIYYSVINLSVHFLIYNYYIEKYCNLLIIE